MQRSLLRTVFQSTRVVRTVVQDAGRARDIAGILAKYGFAAVLQSRRPGRTDKDAPTQDVWDRLVPMVEELGPTFVKFGQILSTRPDVIPPDLAGRLATLQDHVARAPWEDTAATLEEAFGKPAEMVFESIEQTPIASASIAQVYGATLKGGQEVVVKVQRRNLRATIDADLSLMRFLAQRVLDAYPESAYLDLNGMVEEFAKSLMRELDFNTERQSLLRMAENFKGKPRIHIPEVFPEVCSSTVLTMERIRGHKLTALPATIEAGPVDQDDVALVCLDAAYQMVFHDGFFHGDLHPGNVFLEEDGRIGLIDFGMVGRLNRSMRSRVVDVIFSVLREDLEGVARIWYSLGRPTRPVDYAAFEADVIAILETHAVGRPMNEIDIGAFLRELAQGAVRHGIRLPPDFTMMFKAMVTTEGLAKQVAADINPLEAAQPYIETMVKERYSMERLKSKALSDLIYLSDLAQELPGRLSRLVTLAESGDLSFELKQPALEPAAIRLVRALNRGAVGVVVGASLLAGSIAIGKAPAVLLGLPVISIACYLLALLGCMWLGVGLLKGR
jgi:ubiquinone biosynthesis protein